jgi:RHS repeat-associated protein
LNLVKKTEYSYTGDSYLSSSTDIVISDAQTLRSSVHFTYDSKGRPKTKLSRDEQGIQTEKICYTYNSRNEIICQNVYAGSSSTISYSTHTFYDDHGNLAYTRGPEGAEHFYSYANSSSQDRFTDSAGNSVPLFSNAFYTNTLPDDCHTLLIGEAFINEGVVTEVYYHYDTHGNLTETKTLYKTRDYAVYTGTFSESSQISFDMDLSDITLNDGILLISAIPTPTLETLYETHSEYERGWLNTGTWQDSYFLADYTQCTPEPDCFSGQTKIGPFTHYPGTPSYTGYTTWLDENTQYVKTSYIAHVNEYPAQVHYKINAGDWTTFTANLQSGTASTTIPASAFTQGINTLQFQESNTYTTQFAWTLYIDQGATPEEYITGYTYDSYGNPITFTDALNHTTSFQYDVTYHTYLSSITDALNHTTTAIYDSTTGTLISIIDAEENTTSYEYDILGRVIKKINSDLTEKEVLYNDQNNLATIYDELDHKTVWSYDGLGRISGIEWYLSPTDILTETYAYNYLNKVKIKTDPAGHVYTYEYDTKGRIIKLINPDNTVMEAHYNDMTNTIVILDENQHKKEYHYTWVGKLQWVREYTDPVNYYLTEYTYDLAGNLTSFTDGNVNTTIYTYDSLFGISKIIYPDLSEETFTYDNIGNLSQKTIVNGTAIFTYDAINRLNSIHYPDESHITFLYDANGNRTSMTDPEGTTVCEYDSRNRLSSETRIINGNSYTVSYQYDAASHMTSMTYPDQTIVTYERDSMGRVTAIPGYAQFTYTADSLLETMIYGNNTVTTYEYTGSRRPVSIHTQKDTTDLMILNYQYDFAGNIIQLEYKKRLPDQQWIESSQNFEYDWLNRLISTRDGNTTSAYTYDAVGNRLSKNDTTYTYTTMNELLSGSDGSLFTYDGMGNTLTKSTPSDMYMYTHDDKSKLIQVEKNQQIIAEYTYDGDGRRIEKTEWVESLQEYKSIIYGYSGGNVIYEENVHTGVHATYIHGPTGKIAKNVGGLTEYYHRDHLGSTRLITNESGTTCGEISYQPFGELTKSGDTEENHLYTGKEKDSSGLYYFGARYYDPDTGRWIERDLYGGKIENPMSLNRYVYCYNNPLFYVDPDGCDPKVNNASLDLAILSTITGGLSFGLLFPPAGAIWAASNLLIRHWVGKNFEANTKLDAHGNIVVTIYAKGDTFTVGAYFATIEIEQYDKGNYKGYIRNASTTLVSVAISHKGSGTLDLFLSGSGPTLLNIVGSGDINIHLNEDCTGLVTLNIQGTGEVTIYVPKGQPPPQIIGNGEYTLVYYDPEDETEGADKNES